MRWSFGLTNSEQGCTCSIPFTVVFTGEKKKDKSRNPANGNHTRAVSIIDVIVMLVLEQLLQFLLP